MYWAFLILMAAAIIVNFIGGRFAKEKLMGVGAVLGLIAGIVLVVAINRTPSKSSGNPYFLGTFLLIGTHQSEDIQFSGRQLLVVIAESLHEIETIREIDVPRVEQRIFVPGEDGIQVEGASVTGRQFLPLRRRKVGIDDVLLGESVPVNNTGPETPPFREIGQRRRDRSVQVAVLGHPEEFEVPQIPERSRNGTVQRAVYDIQMLQVGQISEGFRQLAGKIVSVDLDELQLRQIPDQGRDRTRGQFFAVRDIQPFQIRQIPEGFRQPAYERTIVHLQTFQVCQIPDLFRQGAGEMTVDIRASHTQVRQIGQIPDLRRKASLDSGVVQIQ